MTLFLGVDQREAQAINLAFFLPTAAAGLFLHRKNGYLDAPVIRTAAPPAVLAALAGALLALRLDAELLRIPFGIFLLYAGGACCGGPGRKTRALCPAAARPPHLTAGAEAFFCLRHQWLLQSRWLSVRIILKTTWGSLLPRRREGRTGKGRRWERRSLRCKHKEIERKNWKGIQCYEKISHPAAGAGPVPGAGHPRCRRHHGDHRRRDHHQCDPQGDQDPPLCRV